MKTEPRSPNPAATLTNERLIAATPQKIFAAFEQPEHLAKWWGPNGFTNTFEQFEFKPGGRWVFVMHGPDGASYQNESFFERLFPPHGLSSNMWSTRGSA